MINNVNNFLSIGEFNKTGGMKRVNWEVQHGRANSIIRYSVAAKQRRIAK